MRRVDEPIEVVADTAPQSFVWRSRRYAVRAVLARWQHRDNWWRTALEEPDEQGNTVLGATVEEPAVGALAAVAHDTVVFRVEASAGRAINTGTFDLSHDLRGRWRLVRLLD